MAGRMRTKAIPPVGSFPAGHLARKVPRGGSANADPQER